ncbi:MAG: SRPBCC domain-containing protein [Byssovorax sp.]
MTKPNAIELDHLYAHPPAAVWKALTDPALHARWWAAGDIRPIVGHRFDLDMGKWGKQPCEVVEVEPERLLRYRFAVGMLETMITFKLAPEGAGTRLTLIQEGFDLDSPMGRQAFEGMKAGWPNVLARLDGALAG